MHFKRFSESCLPMYLPNMNQSELPFKIFHIQHISNMSLSRVFFCCWCMLVYLVYCTTYSSLSESSQFIAFFSLQQFVLLFILSTDLCQWAITKFHKSCLHDGNQQEIISHKGPHHFSLMGWLGLWIQHWRDDEKIHHIHGKSVKHSVYVDLCYFAIFSKLELEVCKLLCWKMAQVIKQKDMASRLYFRYLWVLNLVLLFVLHLRSMSSHLTESHLV